MIGPPIFSTCAAVAAVTSLLGTGPTRIYPNNEAPQDSAKPYVVWRLAQGGGPENCLNDAPDIDAYDVELAVIAETRASMDDVIEAVRDAVEPYSHIIAWGNQGKDKETNLYIGGFKLQWWVNR